MEALTATQATVIAAVISAFTSAIVTPFVQVYINKRQRTKDHQAKIALPLEYIHTLRSLLIRTELNPAIQQIQEKVDAIENFHDAVFNDLEHQHIKADFLQHLKYLALRHQSARPWGDVEYNEAVRIWDYVAPRMVAILKKETLPKPSDPRPED